MFTVEKIKGFIHLFWVVERSCMEGRREEREGEMIVIDIHISRITLNINIFDSPMKGHRLNGSRNKTYLICCLQETHLSFQHRHSLRVKRFTKEFQLGRTRKQAVIAILVSDTHQKKKRFKIKTYCKS